MDLTLRELGTLPPGFLAVFAAIEELSGGEWVEITNGELDFGPWEQIFYGEFDGQRRKRIMIKIIGE